MSVTVRRQESFAPRSLRYLTLSPFEKGGFTPRQYTLLASAEGILVDEEYYELLMTLLKEQDLWDTVRDRIEFVQGDSTDSQVAWLLDQVEAKPSTIRISWEHTLPSLRLRSEIRELKDRGYLSEVYPSPHIIAREALRIRLPWLKSRRFRTVKVLDQGLLRLERQTLRETLASDQVLVLDFEGKELEQILRSLLAAGADPYRGLALVSYHPLSASRCWMSSLGEIQEWLKLWRQEGITLVYLEPDRAALRQLVLQ
jgi:hypothetical protein